MSIAYLDPGNIESDLQAGAAAEYKVNVHIWTMDILLCTVVFVVLLHNLFL